MPEKTFIPLENNPEVFTHLSHALGLSTNLKFHDVFSFDVDLTSDLPRPIHALLMIIPMTPAWRASREVEDSQMPAYTGSGPDEPVLWFKQTIGHACGLIGLLHCVLNGSAKKFLLPGGTFAQIRERAVPLGVVERARVLEESKDLEDAHAEAALMGDTKAPGRDVVDNSHFVAFVKGDDGVLYELEGGAGRKGPLKRGWIGEEDLLSQKALDLGVGKLLKMEGVGGDMGFSCIALTGE